MENNIQFKEPFLPDIYDFVENFRDQPESPSLLKYLIRGHLYPQSWLITVFCYGKGLLHTSYARALTMLARLGEEIPDFDDDTAFRNHMQSVIDRQQQLHEDNVRSLDSPFKEERKEALRQERRLLENSFRKPWKTFWIEVVAFVVAVFIGWGEGGVGAYEIYAKILPRNKTAASASAIPVFVGSMLCNFYLVRDDTIDFLTKLLSCQLFKDKDGDPLSYTACFSILLTVVGGALTSGVALGALELRDNQKIFTLGPAIVLASGASVGFTAIYATVITDFIKETTWLTLCHYLRNCSLIEFSKLLIGQLLNIIYCITQYYVFKSSIAGFFTHVLAIAVPAAWVIEIIALATVITDGFFGARKIQQQLDKFQQVCITLFHYYRNTATREQPAENAPEENVVQKSVNTYLSRTLTLARICLFLNTIGMVALNITEEAEDIFTNLIPFPVNKYIIYAFIILATIARSGLPNNNAIGESFAKDHVTPLTFFTQGQSTENDNKEIVREEFSIDSTA